MNISIYTSFYKMKLLLPLLALLLAGCIGENDTPTDDGERVDIDLNIHLGLKAAMPHDGTPQERLLTSIRVFVFHKNGYLDNTEHAANALGLTGNPEVMQLTILSGDKTFCVIGNEPAALATSLAAVRSIRELQALVMSDDFNMVGSLIPFASTHQQTIAPGHTLPVQIGLVRAVAKAEMKLIKDPQNTDAITFISAQIINTPTHSTLMDGHPLAVSTRLAPLAMQTFNQSVGATAADTIAITPLYLFEHLTGAGDATTNNATLLQVKLNMNGVATTFAIPLRTLNSLGQKLNNVTRNSIYRLRLTIFAQSIRIDYDINPWDNESPWDKQAGENDSNLQFTEWEEGNNYDHTLPIAP